MVNNKWWSLFASVFLFSAATHAAPTIGDISSSQQSMIMLKSALERAKMEKELNAMKDVKVSATDLCTSKDLGMLSLRAIYGVGDKIYASFYYNASSVFESQVGDYLLCGEKVEKISIDKVQVKKNDVTYIISGSSHAVIK